jgi:hypothetical protein
MANKTVYETLWDNLSPEEFLKVDKAVSMCHYDKMLDNDITWEDIGTVLKEKIIVKPFLGETYDKLFKLYTLADIEAGREELTSKLKDLLHDLKLYTHGKGPLSKEADELTGMVDSLEYMLGILKGGD